MGEAMTEIYDKIKGHAVTQSDAKPALPQALRDAAENLLIAVGMGWDIEGCVDNLRDALAQSDAAAHREEELRDDERLGAALRRAQDAEDRLAALPQSDAEPVAWERALNCACHQFESYVRQEKLTTPEDRRIALSDALQHAVGLLQIAAPPRPDASAGLIEAADYIPPGGAGNGA
jgi:hypothetical protein